MYFLCHIWSCTCTTLIELCFTQHIETLGTVFLALIMDWY